MLHFDSSFESGNADIVILKNRFEYDVYPRPDANTKGHGYWYYFSVKTPWHPDRVKKYKDYSSYKEEEDLKNKMKVKFNIHRALDTNGMKICYRSKFPYPISSQRCEVAKRRGKFEHFPEDNFNLSQGKYYREIRSQC